MANTYTLISSNTVGSGGAASVTFSSIPATYTDLLLRSSVRNTGSSGLSFAIQYNGSTTNYSGRYLEGSGAAASSGTIASTSFNQAGLMPVSTYTASTFGSNDLYIPNYTASQNKSSSLDATTENNAATSYIDLIANLWADTTAISSMYIYAPAGSFAQYSTFYLYGIKNS
jgi:hypothetical protein